MKQLNKKEDYFAFPTLSQLKEIPLEFFRKCGCGYRSEYLVDTISKLENFNLDEIYNLDVVSARKKLMMLKGVGRKVADCVLLFCCRCCCFNQFIMMANKRNTHLSTVSNASVCSFLRPSGHTFAVSTPPTSEEKKR